jgi:7-cyano-7-deazaguanine synthase in queuosine biosynthesis
MSLGNLHYHDCPECSKRLPCFRPITHATHCDSCIARHHGINEANRAEKALEAAQSLET